MISVPNLLQPLSGSRNIAIVFFVLIFASSCGVFTGGNTGVKGNTKGNTTSPEDIVVDTVKWTKIPEDKSPPISNEKETDIPDTKVPKGKKSTYSVTCFLPLESNRVNTNVEDPESLRNLKYIQYYAGMKLAMEDLEKEGISLQLDVYDSKEDVNNVRSILAGGVSLETDVIMGSTKKEILMDLAKFGKENEIPIISPWYSSKSITQQNPYYIQLTPYLTEHYRAITEHALKNFDASQIYLVGRAGTKDVNRFKFFQEVAYDITQEENSLQNFAFDIDSLSYEYEIFKSVISSEEPTVFIIPNWSPRESQFIYDVLRRINVEKLQNEVYVYGMPVLYQMDKITFEYYTNLNMRIVMPHFTERASPQSQNFVSRYFREYNDHPMDEAFEGYDNMMFVGRALYNYGGDFINHLDKDKMEYFSTRYDIQAVINSEKEEDVLQYYENRNLRVIQFGEDHFEILRF